MENAETAETAKGPAPAPTAEGPAPAPAPAATLERPHSKNKEKFSTASTYSDFYIRTLFQPGLVDTQYNIDLL